MVKLWRWFCRLFRPSRLVSGTYQADKFQGHLRPDEIERQDPFRAPPGSTFGKLDERGVGPTGPQWPKGGPTGPRERVHLTGPSGPQAIPLPVLADRIMLPRTDRSKPPIYGTVQSMQAGMDSFKSGEWQVTYRVKIDEVELVER
jgi:hypothetical protein